MIKVRTTVANVEKHLIITGHSVNMLGELIKETHVKDTKMAVIMQIMNEIINYFNSDLLC